MTNSEVVVQMLQTVSDMLIFLIPVIAVCAVVKLIFDVLYDFLFNISGRSR